MIFIVWWLRWRSWRLLTSMRPILITTSAVWMSSIRLNYRRCTMLSAIPYSIGAILKLNLLALLQPPESILELEVKEIPLRRISKIAKHFLLSLIQSITFDLHSQTQDNNFKKSHPPILDILINDSFRPAAAVGSFSSQFMSGLPPWAPSSDSSLLKSIEIWCWCCRWCFSCVLAWSFRLNGTLLIRLLIRPYF